MSTTPVRYTMLPTPLGDLLVTDHGQGLSGLYFPDHRRGRAVAPEWIHDPAPFTSVADGLDVFLRTGVHQFDLPFDLQGSDLQRATWEALLAIPIGTTTSYGHLAAQIGRPGAARAVAGAIARNPISIVVPCHRVVGVSGALTGYAGGVDRKRFLLTLEGVDLEAPVSPSRRAPAS